jgi:hypothetical protein
MEMKKAIVITLVGINAALLVALMLGTSTPTAEAQVARGGADYLMVTGHVGKDWDAVYVLDMGARRILGWQFNKTTKRLEPYRGRSLETDFQTRQPAQPDVGRSMRRR